MRCLDMCVPKGLKRDPPMRIEYSHTTGDKRLLFSFDGRSCSLPPLRSRHPWWYTEGERAPEQTPGSPPRSKTPEAATGGFDPTALPAGLAERVGEGDYDALEGWLMHGGHVHAVDAMTGLSLLMISASQPKPELVGLLLAQGPAVHIDTQASSPPPPIRPRPPSSTHPSPVAGPRGAHGADARGGARPPRERRAAPARGRVAASTRR